MRAAWLLVAATTACTSDETPAFEPDEPTPDLPSVVIILTDTVRADHVGAYDYVRNTTPLFDGFARHGFLFERAYAPTSWTRPAVASLFTGLYPQRHGVQMRQDALATSIPTLAERLASLGMKTAMITTNPHVTETWGLTRGFSEVIQLTPDPDRLKSGNRASVVLHELGRLVPKLKPPFFLYVHLIDPHFPYQPPRRDLDAIAPNGTPSTATLYDGELHYADRHIGAMLDMLNDAWLLDDAIVVLTADHGEELHDHGSTGHGKTLYQEVVHIPLAIGVPPAWQHRLLGGQGGLVTTCPRIAATVSLVDLMPTLISLAGSRVDENASATDGIDLTPAMRCDELESRPLFFSIDKEDASLAGILVENAKLIVDRTTGARELYALDSNPYEEPHGPPKRQTVRDLEERLATLLDAFETSALPGVHLELAGRAEESAQNRVTVVLTTDGRFVDMTLFGLEQEDHARILDNGRRLKIDAVLRAEWHSVPKDLWVQDRDELTFQVEPPDAAVRIDVRIDGCRPVPGLVRPVERVPLPRRLTRSQLRAAAFFDRRPAGVYLYEQSHRPERVEKVPHEIEVALRALGYVQ